MSEQKQYLRFSAAQRIEHWAQMLSFTTLALTGLPQKFAGESWAESMIALCGGIEIVRTIHHTAAIVLCLACIYHVISVAYKIFILRVRWTMFPRLDDVLDALDQVRYNLGLTKELPKFDRFSFAEKFEYWAFVWGAVMMSVTGFIMWNPIYAVRFLPGDLIPAAKAAHGGEALLAVLAIIIWHFYNVHIKIFSKAMFTGKLSEHEMLHEHGFELERINAGKIDLRPSPQVIKNRERWFIPVATVVAVGLLITLYFFTNYEHTAITTLPKRATVQVYAPITMTPTPRPATPTVAIAAKALPPDHEGRTACLVCHGNNIGPQVPIDHAGRTDAMCTVCHKLGSAITPAAGATPAATSATPAAGVPMPQPADHVGRAICLACHQTLPDPQLPADHAGHTDAMCVACHAAPSSAPAATVATTAAATKASSSSSATATATKVSSSSNVTATTAPTAGVPMPQPTDHVGRAICLACHQTLPDPQLPADHAGRTDAMCVTCHPLVDSTLTPAATQAPITGTAATVVPTASVPKP